MPSGAFHERSSPLRSLDRLYFTKRPRPSLERNDPHSTSGQSGLAEKRYSMYRLSISTILKGTIGETFVGAPSGEDHASHAYHPQLAVRRGHSFVADRDVRRRAMDVHRAGTSPVLSDPRNDDRVARNHAVLGRLVAITETVRRGDPFVASNAYRLQAIAWVLLALQLLSLVIGGIGKAISTPAYPVHLDAGFSPSSWLAVILTLVLARVFAEGTLMREDLQGTV